MNTVSAIQRPTPIIDTHSHLQFHAFKSDAENVIQKTLAQNIWMINVGTKYQTSQSAVVMAEKYKEGVYADIGLHPMYAAAEFIKLKHDANEEEDFVLENNFDKEKYKQLATSKKVVAIGEIGLDYYYKPKTAEKLQQFKEKQKQVFLQQLDLAEELNLPVILHCRMAHQDILDILNSKRNKFGSGHKNQNAKLRGVVHCFTGTTEEMKRYVDMGFYIGINGIIFKFDIDQVIKEISLDNILVETDCPYLTPPMAESKRNEPLFIKHTIQKIAELKGVSFQEVADITTQNAKKLFKI